MPYNTNDDETLPMQSEPVQATLSLTTKEYEQALAWLIHWKFSNGSSPFACVCNIFDREPTTVLADIEIMKRQIDRERRFPTSCADY